MDILGTLSAQHGLFQGLGVFVLNIFARITYGLFSKSGNVNFIDRILPLSEIRFLYSLNSDPQILEKSSAPNVLQVIEVKGEQSFGSHGNVLNLLDRSLIERRKVLLLGEPGSGKSASLMALIHQRARKALTSLLIVNIIILITSILLAILLNPAAIGLIILTSYSDQILRIFPIPIFLEMRWVEESNFLEYAKSVISSCDGGEYLSCRFEKMAASGKIFLVVDGINEIGSHYRDNVLKEIRKLFSLGTHFSRVSAIFTSREIEYSTDELPINRTYLMQKLDDNGVKACLLYYGSSQPEQDLCILENQKMLSDLGYARNPFWLKLMIEAGLYTENRGALFENYTRKAVINECKKRSYKQSSIEDILEFLAKLADRAQQDGFVGLSYRATQELIGESTLNKSMIEIAIGAKLIIFKDSLNARYAFDHHLFQEFLSAYHHLINIKKNISSKDSADKNSLLHQSMINHIDNPSYWGTIIMYAGIIDTHKIKSESVEFVGSKEDYIGFIDEVVRSATTDNSKLLSLGLISSSGGNEPAIKYRFFNKIINNIGNSLRVDSASLSQLVKIVGDSVIDQIFEVIKLGINEDVRNALLVEITKVKSSRVFENLVDCLSLSLLRPKVTEIILQNFEQSVLPLVQKANSSPSMMKEILTIFKSMKAQSVKPCMKLIEDPAYPYGDVTAQIIIAVGEPFIEELIRALDDNSEDVRNRVERSLIGIGKPSIKPVLGLLRKGDEFRQGIAISILTKIDQGVMDSILQDWNTIGDNEADHEIKANYIALIDNLRDNKSETILLDCLEHRSATIRKKATRALKNLGHEPKASEQEKIKLTINQNIAQPLLIILIVLSSFECSRIILSAFETIKPINHLHYLLYNFLLASLAATLYLKTISIHNRKSRNTLNKPLILFSSLSISYFSWNFTLRILNTFTSDKVTLETITPETAILGMSFSLITFIILNKNQTRKLIILGDKKLIDLLLSYKNNSLERNTIDVVGYGTFSDCMNLRTGKSHNVLDVIHQTHANAVIFYYRDALKINDNDLNLGNLITLKSNNIILENIADTIEFHCGRIPVEYLLDELVIDDFLNESFSKREYLFRFFDIVMSLFFFALMLPIIILTCIAIFLESGGPIIYRQTRVGLNNENFDIYKFRSMRQDAEKDGKAVWARQNDSRVTRVGAFIRNTGIDELPQLVNILKGNMSFVGPRPERPEFIHDLERQIPFYGMRHHVKPGLMGWSQLMYPYGASLDDALTKMEYDLFYIKHRSILMNLAIIVELTGSLLSRRGIR